MNPKWPETLKRSLIANYLGIILFVLTVSVGGAGYFTYYSLNEVVSSLEIDSRPNTNLLLYKEINLSLQEMDDLVETYQISKEERYKVRFEETGRKVDQLLDSISGLNPDDSDMVIYNDSLQSMILKSRFVHEELLKYVNEPDFQGLSDLNKVTQRLPKVTSVPTAEPVAIPESEEKKSFLKRIFAKEQKAQPEVVAKVMLNSDSLLLAQKNQIQQEINKQINRIKANAIQQSENRKQEEVKLRLAHLDLQSQIIDLIGFLESRENVKIQISSLKAQELAYRTNEQIRVFFILATLMLLSSLLSMVVYVKKNRAYQLLMSESKTATENLAKAKERFFANMSHELRTPMNAISGFTKILMKSDLNATQKEHTQIIHKSSEHLLKLLNDILDFSKLQAEKLRLESVPFDVTEICNECIKLMSEGASKKGLALSFICENPLLAVIGDPNRLRQILLNLLSNAIKYTEKGEVILTVTAKERSTGYKISFEVRDTGIGIPQNQRYRLFREFEQADQSSFSKGTGLGLAITKQLIRLHGGSIRLESKENSGTSVYISITYPLSESALPVNTDVEVEPSLAGIRVLVADDEPFNVKLLSTLFEGKGILSFVAQDGKIALEMAMRNSYDVILLDLKMPGLSGWEVAGKIRESKGPNQETPIIALTATLGKMDQEKGLKAGFDFIMRKPFDESALFSLIAEKTKYQSHSQETTTDLSSLLTMGNKAFVTDMIETFITSATTGIGELKDQLHQRQYLNVAMVAHRIVAPARHFKAEKLVVQLKNLEKRAESADVTLHDDDISAIERELEQVINSLHLNLQNHVD